MRPPAFWHHDGGRVLPFLLAPFAAVTAAATARRVARPGWRAPVPVICCGNASIGGAGKTTLALDIGRRLLARGAAVAFITRGYGGRAALPAMAVDLVRHGVDDVGDEALLLATVAPTFVSGDRAAAARAAIEAGADALVMDDGLQNATLQKSMSLLVVDGEVGFGNGHLLPAGPLREPVSAAAARCRACVLIGEDRTNASALVPAGFPVLRARLTSCFDAAMFGGRTILAFAGIARPEKFFASLEQAGANLVARRGFADHHRFKQHELAAVLAEADRLGATAVTTPKDAVRLPREIRDRVHVVDVALTWADPTRIERLLDEALVR